MSCESKSETGLATSNPIEQALVHLSAERKADSYTLDEQDRKILEKMSPQTITRIDNREALTFQDVIQLSNSGLCDQSIIQYIKETRSRYALSQNQIQALQNAGVSPKVISYIIETSR
jgi:site-specific recombinase XerC